MRDILGESGRVRLWGEKRLASHLDTGGGNQKKSGVLAWNKPGARTGQDQNRDSVKRVNKDLLMNLKGLWSTYEVDERGKKREEEAVAGTRNAVN